ncbi:MAG: CAP domain-containing protein [Kineosporiaceae bacterium]
MSDSPFPPMWQGGTRLDPALPNRRDLRRRERRQAGHRRRVIAGVAAAGTLGIGAALAAAAVGDGSLVGVADDRARVGAEAAALPTSGPEIQFGTRTTITPGTTATPPPDTVAAPPPPPPTTSSPPPPPETSAPPPAPPPPPPPPADPPPAEPPSVLSAGPPQAVLDLVNDARSEAGCGALGMDDQLTAAAQGHAEDMAANGYFSHDSKDGRSPFDRMGDAGYDYRAAGENIARGQPDPQAVMAAWMDSPGHRENILNCSFEDLGVGYVEGSGGPWWVQNFGAA